MEIVFVLVPIALILVGIIVGAFWWATQSGQFDDLEGPAHRILMDDDDKPPTSSSPSTHDGGSNADSPCDER